MKNIGNLYFANNRTVIIVRYISIFILGLGVGSASFADGWGIIGLLVLSLGAILFFACTSKIVSDKEYDGHLSAILKTVDTYDGEFEYLNKWEFFAFGTGSKCRKGSDGKYRTDSYSFTRILASKTAFRIARHTVNYTGETQSDVFVAEISDVTVKQISKKNDLTELCYIEVASAKQGAFEFPVPVNNYDVEEMLRYLTAK